MRLGMLNVRHLIVGQMGIKDHNFHNRDEGSFLIDNDWLVDGS